MRRGMERERKREGIRGGEGEREENISVWVFYIYNV